MRISDWSSDVCSSDLRYSAEAWRSLLRPSAETFTLPTASAEKLPPSADSASARRNTEGPAPVTATRTPAGPLATMTPTMASREAGLANFPHERQSVGQGTRVPVRVDLGGRCILNKKT